MPTTESDLRRELVALADRDEPDVDAFRARLAGVADQPGVDEPGAGAGVALVHILPGDRFERRRRGRVVAPIVAVAACVAAVLLVIGLVYGLPGQGSRRAPARVGSSLPEPEPSLPGSVIVADYAGVGRGTIVVPRYRLPAHYELAANVACKGAGGIRLSTGVSTPKCGAAVIGGSFPTSVRRLRVAVDPHTRWRLTLARQPKIRTNGSVQTPVEREFAHPDRNELGRGHGSGNGIVDLTQPPKSNPHAQIVLTCRGAGVTIAGGSETLFKTLYTHTCFDGSEYVFDITKYAVPNSLIISAAAGTTWRLFVRPN